MNEGHGFSSRTTRHAALEGLRVCVRTKRKPQISPLRYAPVPRHAGAGEMTILFEYRIPRFQERSAEPQIPRLRFATLGVCDFIGL